MEEKEIIIEKDIVEEEKVEIRKEMDKPVYSIMSGNGDEEYYSYKAPFSKANKIVISNPFLKGTKRENILDTFIEVYFVMPINNTEIVDGENCLLFEMSEGILIKEHIALDLNWLMKWEVEAVQELKDKTILQYQQLVPALMNKVKQIETQLQSNYEQNNYQNDKNLLKL